VCSHNDQVDIVFSRPFGDVPGGIALCDNALYTFFRQFDQVVSQSSCRFIFKGFQPLHIKTRGFTSSIPARRYLDNMQQSDARTKAARKRFHLLFELFARLGEIDWKQNMIECHG